MHHRAPRWIAFALVAVVAGCDATQSSVPPASGEPSAASPGAPAGTDAASTLGPPGPPVEPEPGEPGPLGMEPLPQPRLTDGFDIGQALYDPAQVPVGVVSLLASMGVAITTDDGQVIRAGEDHGSGILTLTESDVRGWIEITTDDLTFLQDDLPGRGSIDALFRAVRSSLSSDLTVDQLAANFADAYAANPDALAAQILLGQPIEASTRLLRIQQWVLLLDGFSGAGTAGRGPGSPGTAVLAAYEPRRVQSPFGAPGVGAAALFQPPLTSPLPGTSDATWLRVLATLPTLAYRVPFAIQGARPIHEGHGGPGDRLELTARYGRPVSFGINQDFIFLGNDPVGGLGITWTSTDEARLRRHGQVRNGQLGSEVFADDDGAVRIGYEARPEEARRRLVEVEERVSLTATVDALHLVLYAFELEPELRAVLECQCLITGRVSAYPGSFEIGWHAEEVLEISIDNYYNFTIGVGGIAELHRNGVDRAVGALARDPDDGTWRGTVEVLNSGHAEGTVVLGLAGIGECGAGDDLLGGQTLYVVGEPVPGDQIRLRFYPETPPEGGETTCQAYIRFPGGGAYRRPAGTYVPLNDTRWSSPDQGMLIDIPPTFGRLSYSDQSAIVPDLGVCSAFYVTVNRVDPEQPYPTPTPVGSPRDYLCN